jgi:hypothetical protein
MTKHDPTSRLAGQRSINPNICLAQDLDIFLDSTEIKASLSELVSQAIHTIPNLFIIAF